MYADVRAFSNLMFGTQSKFIEYKTFNKNCKSIEEEGYKTAKCKGDTILNKKLDQAVNSTEKSRNGKRNTSKCSCDKRIRVIGNSCRSISKELNTISKEVLLETRSKFKKHSRGYLDGRKMRAVNLTMDEGMIEVNDSIRKLTLQELEGKSLIYFKRCPIDEHKPYTGELSFDNTKIQRKRNSLAVNAPITVKKVKFSPQRKDFKDTRKNLFRLKTTKKAPKIELTNQTNIYPQIFSISDYRRALKFCNKVLGSEDLFKSVRIHQINIVIELINKFSLICFQQSGFSNTREEAILYMGRLLKLGISRLQVRNPEFFKDREAMEEIKEKLVRLLWAVLNRENEVSVNQINNAGNVKSFIGNGNNPITVKSVLKQRWWWNITDNMETAQLLWTQWKKGSFIKSLPSIYDGIKDENNMKICNHIEGNAHLGNKKALFYNMKAYYEAIAKNPFEAIPLTFHLSQGLNDIQFNEFVEEFMRIKEANKEENVWIVKPGENSNRGQGINICKTLPDIKGIISNSTKGTYIIQKYIEKPLLINKRKFDIRCYSLITAFNGHVKGYFYKEGYLRTASREFSLKNLTAKIIHLTNEAIQVRYEEFGKYEPGNKITYADFNKYLESTYPELTINFYRDILPQIRQLVTDTIRATYGKLDPQGRKQTFEIFGYDFMLDESFHLYLIEANINPCLEIKSPVTARIVPAMLNSAFRIALDPLFQPPPDTARKLDLIELKHELIYDSKIDDKELKGLLKSVMVEIEDDDNDNV